MFAWSCTAAQPLLWMGLEIQSTAFTHRWRWRTSQTRRCPSLTGTAPWTAAWTAHLGLDPQTAEPGLGLPSLLSDWMNTDRPTERQTEEERGVEDRGLVHRVGTLLGGGGVLLEWPQVHKVHKKLRSALMANTEIKKKTTHFLNQHQKLIIEGRKKETPSLSATTCIQSVNGLRLTVMHRDEGSEMWANPFRLLRSFAQTLLKCLFFILIFFWRPASSENKSRKNCDYRKQNSLNKQGGVKRLFILVFIDSNALTVCFPAKLICEFQVVSKVTRHPPPRWNYRGKMFVTVKHRERVINILSLKHGAIRRQLLYLWTNGTLFWLLFFRVRSSLADGAPVVGDALIGRCSHLQLFHNRDTFKHKLVWDDNEQLPTPVNSRLIKKSFVFCSP